MSSSTSPDSANDPTSGNVLQGPTSQFYFSQRLRLHYVDWGNEGAPTMLLIHGGRDHCRNWDWVAQHFRHDYHIIAPDLRGHGDSSWLVGGSYNQVDYVYDIAQLVKHLDAGPLTVIGHSLGGSISLNYTGLYPETVQKLVSIEGMGPPPKMIEERRNRPVADRLQEWSDGVRSASGRIPRRYKSLEEAYQRMKEENPHLSSDQARHLTIHGINKNEDGTYSWKFDNYIRIMSPLGLPEQHVYELWGRINCPTMLVRGTESWASDPEKDGRAKHLKFPEVVNIENAGHWVHHDQLDVFINHVKAFLAR